MNYVKFCSCKACKAGKHCKQSKLRTKKVMRGARRRWNKAAKDGNDESIGPVSVPYTD